MNAKKLLAKFAENWPAKALSIALAVVLFIFHRMSTLEERFFLVPLSFESSGNLIPSKSYPRMIRINLKGDANTITPIVEDDIEAFIDMGKFQMPGDYRAEVQVRKKGTALGVEPLQIRLDPQDIDLSLDYKISKFVPLVVSLSGDVEAGFYLSSHSLAPAQIVIDGPSQLVSSISDLYTETIDLGGKHEDFDMTVNILNPNPLIVIRGSGSTEFHGYISRIGRLYLPPPDYIEKIEDEDPLHEEGEE